MGAARSMNFAPAVGAAVKPGPKYGAVGQICGHWRLREYARCGEWMAVCCACEHFQLVRINDAYLPRCRCCGRSSSYQRPSVRPKYLQTKR